MCDLIMLGYSWMFHWLNFWICSGLLNIWEALTTCSFLQNMAFHCIHYWRQLTKEPAQWLCNRAFGRGIMICCSKLFMLFPKLHTHLSLFIIFVQNILDTQISFMIKFWLWCMGSRFVGMNVLKTLFATMIICIISPQSFHKSSLPEQS
jgi:hypothetical protein